MAVITYMLIIFDFIDCECGEEFTFCNGTKYCLSSYENAGKNMRGINPYCSNKYGEDVTRIYEISEEEKQILDKCKYWF